MFFVVVLFEDTLVYSDKFTKLYFTMQFLQNLIL